MRKLGFVLSILATVGVFVADLLLLGVPAFRNGWWTLAFFAAPLGLAILSGSWKERVRLGVAAWLVLVAGLAGYVAMRVGYGNVSGTPAVAAGAKAPDFTLKDQDGRDASLGDYLKQGRVLLVFFRGTG